MAVMPWPRAWRRRSGPDVHLHQPAEPPSTGTWRAGSITVPEDRPEDFDALIDEFADGWQRGVNPRAEDFLDRLPDRDPAAVVELIYHEFCLAEGAGLEPDPAAYLDRFPAYRDRLARLLGLHEAISPSELGLAVAPADLPGVGDEIGPYRLLRELGRGTFARVFLAEQTDLEDRLVVVKVASRGTPEPRLAGAGPASAHRRGPAHRRDRRRRLAPGLHAVSGRRDAGGRARRTPTPRPPATHRAATCWRSSTASAAPEYLAVSPMRPAARAPRGPVISQSRRLARRPARRGPRLRPPAGRRARRPEAFEHPADGRRPADALRLQPGVARRSTRPTTRAARSPTWPPNGFWPWPILSMRCRCLQPPGTAPIFMLSG